MIQIFFKVKLIFCHNYTGEVHVLLINDKTYMKEKKMGVLTHELLASDGTDTAMEWLKKGCLEKRLQELADRIDAGEKIGMVSHLVYRNKDDYTGKFNLKQVYEEIKSDVGFAKELLKAEKERKAGFAAYAAEFGLDSNDVDDLDDDDDLGFDVDDEIAKLEAKHADDLKSDDDDFEKERRTKQKEEEKDNAYSSWWKYCNGFSPAEAERAAASQREKWGVFDFSDDDLFGEPADDDWKKIKKGFIQLNQTPDKMKLEINKLEEAIRKTYPAYYVQLKDGGQWSLKNLLSIAKEAYAEATAEPTEAQLKKRKEVFIKLNTTTDEMKSQINKVEEYIRKYGPDIYNVVSDGSVWKLKYLLQIAKEAYAEATENKKKKKNDVSGADKTEENDNADNLEKELEKIKKLFEKGLIDESDYKAKKNKLLGI